MLLKQKRPGVPVEAPACAVFLQHVRALRRDDVSVHYCSPGVRAELPARIPPGNMAMLVEASCVVSGHPVVGQAAGTDTISHLGILCAATAASCNANDAHVSGSTARQHNSGGGPLHVARVQLTHRQHRPEVAPAHLCSLSGNAIPPIRFQQHGL